MNRRIWLFFLPLGVGAVLGVGTFATMMGVLLTDYASYTMAFFFGIVLGSLPVVYRAHTHMRPSFLKVLLLLFMCAGMIVFSLLNPGDISYSTSGERYSFYLLLSGFSPRLKCGKFGCRGTGLHTRRSLKGRVVATPPHRQHQKKTPPLDIMWCPLRIYSGTVIPVWGG